jgi:hypothetical protein
MSEELKGTEGTEGGSGEQAPASRGARRIEKLTTDLASAHERIKLLEADTVTLERDQLAEARAQLEAKLERMTADHQAATLQWQTSEAMLRRGLKDDEGQAVAMALYQRLPEDGRPALAAWMDGWKGEDADNTPAALRPYLRTEQAPVAPVAPKLEGRQPTGSPGVLGSIPDSIRAAAARGDKDAQEAIRAYLAGRR